MEQTFGPGAQRPSAELPPAPSRPSRTSVAVPVPPGARPGDEVTVTARRGSVLAVVPDDARESGTMEVELPADAPLRENMS